MTTITYKQALDIMRTESKSCFDHVNATKHVILPPKYVGQTKKGIIEQLNSELRLSTDEFGGALIAYNNIRLLQQMGCVMDEKPYIHFDIQADFVVFKPTVGCKLKGVVNKISSHHIGCLVHNCFNASIPQPQDSSKKWEGFKLSLGQEFTFEVTGIYSYNKVLSLRGKLPDTRSGTKKRKHTSLNADSADISVAEEPDVLTSPKSNKKKKKKKRHSDLCPSAAINADTQDESFTSITEKSSIIDDIQIKNQNKEMEDLHNDSSSITAHDSNTQTFMEVDDTDTTSEKDKKKSARKKKSNKLSVSFMDSSVTDKIEKIKGLDDEDELSNPVIQTVTEIHQSVSLDESNSVVLKKHKKKKKRRNSEPINITNFSSDVNQNSMVSSPELFSDTVNGDAETLSNKQDNNTLENGLLSSSLDGTGNTSHKRKKSKKEKHRKVEEQEAFHDISVSVDKTELNTSSLADSMADTPVKPKKHKKHKTKKKSLNVTV